ncbi:hypothetical protein OBBRIDRAFT_715150, partial [Obba rivulosa]
GPSQLLVEVQATGLNQVDWKTQPYGLPVENFPEISGSDAADTVEAIGEGVQRFSSGGSVWV